MDLSKIENKLESGVYKSVAQFEADFQLMWDNCAEFNGDDSGAFNFLSHACLCLLTFKRLFLSFFLFRVHGGGQAAGNSPAQVHAPTVAAQAPPRQRPRGLREFVRAILLATRRSR